jgi:hypothetical protein
MNKEAIGTLTGKYFHSVKSDRETIEWQGKFLGLASPGLYRVQLFELPSPGFGLGSWINGTESEQRLVPATDMRYWLVYDSAEAMQAHYYDVYCPKMQAKEENLCAARIGNDVCQMERGHSGKHKDGGSSWTDIEAAQYVKKFNGVKAGV